MQTLGGKSKGRWEINAYHVNLLQGMCPVRVTPA